MNDAQMCAQLVDFKRCRLGRDCHWSKHHRSGRGEDEGKPHMMNDGGGASRARHHGTTTNTRNGPATVNKKCNHLFVVRPRFAGILNGRSDRSVVAPLRPVLRGSRGAPRAVVASVADPGWSRVTRSGTVEARGAVRAVGRVGRAGKVVVRAVRARLLVRRSDWAVAPGWRRSRVCACKQVSQV